MKMRTNLYTNGLSFIKLFVLLMIITSCNKDFPNILKEFGEQPNYNSGSSKVLYIIADGVRGKAMQQLELPNFRIIARNSLHTFGSLGDFRNNAFSKEAGLANLLTGVTNTKHKVVGNDFSQADLTNYPSILSRINSKTSSFSSATFTSNSALSANLFKDADKNAVLQSDAEIVARVQEELSTTTTDFIVANLSEAYTVGLANSFEVTDDAYVNALRSFDQYVADLIGSIQNRASFQEENWLVIITSSIGGPAINDQPDLTQFGDNDRNTITYFYSPKFARGLLVRPTANEVPFTGSAVNYTYGGTAVNAILENAEDFDFGSNTNDFSINFFIKTNDTESHNYPIILSKRATGFGGSGWNLFLEVRNGDNKIGWNSNISNQTFGTKRINDGNWHSFTVTVSRSGTNDTVKVYTDGVFNAKNSLNGNSLSNSAPLVIGKKAGDGNESPNLIIANLQIFNTALSEAEVAEYGGLGTVDNRHPKFANLIGYWPGYDDVGTNRLTDLTGNGNHMALVGGYNWVSYSDLVSYFRPNLTEAFYKLVPNSVDLPLFIYQWFGMIPVESWGLEGKSWTPSLLVSSN